MSDPAGPASDELDPFAELARCAGLGQALPAPAAARLHALFVAYFWGELAADEFIARLGLPVDEQPTKDSRRRRAESRREWVRYNVRFYHARGFPLSDPARRPGTAFHMAADYLGMSVSTLYDIYRGKR